MDVTFALTLNPALALVSMSMAPNSQSLAISFFDGTCLFITSVPVLAVGNVNSLSTYGLEVL